MKTLLNKKLTAFIILIVLYAGTTKAQNIFPSSGATGIGTTTPNASSLLEIKSTTKGLLIPRMTLAQRNAITSPATGLMIYQTNSTPGFYYYSGSAWTAVTPKGNSWSLTGNAGTIPGTNFIGTTDAKSLVFKVNNQNAGLIDYSTFNTGTRNTAFGEIALNSNTLGIENTAMGYGTLYTNTTGNANSALGKYALFNNNGNYNTGLGYSAMFFNTAGSYNTANGSYALENNTYGNNLVAVGASALFNNGTGAKQPYDGVQNTAIGSASLYANTIGYNNTASGYASLLNNTTGFNNAAYGVQALQSNISGIGNTAVGVLADVNAGGLTNATAIGYDAQATASNQVMLGNTSLLGVQAAGGYYIWADIQFKKNVKEESHGLDFINQLKPITYNYDIHKLNAFIAPQTNKKDSLSTNEKNTIEEAIQNKEKILYSGFVAQDVETAAKKIGYEFSGVHKPQNDKDPYALSYSDFVVPLVKAVQELSKMNDAKDAKIDTLQNQLNELRTLVLSIQQQQQSCSPCSAAVATNAGATQSYAVITDGASLQQNIPNPFTNNTTIGYSLLQKITSAQIIITDKSGKTLKAITISGSGKGTVNVDASTLSSGAYQYSLVVDGRLIDTKQMVLAK